MLNLRSVNQRAVKHGFGSYERCQIAERRVRLANRNLGNAGRITPRSLERQGLPTSLAVDYCELLYGPPPQATRLGGARKRKSEYASQR
jgi:hypothetical protein